MARKSNKSVSVTVGVPVIVRGRQRAPGETVEVSEAQAKRFERKGWIAKAKKHTSTRAKGGPTPQAGESKADPSKAKAKDDEADKSKSDKD